MKLFPLVAFLLAICLAAHAAEPKPRRLLAGAATSNITPEIGAIIVGGFDPFPATHIHDELHARCLVLDNGEKRLAFVVCDNLGASRQMYDEAARFVTAETGIPRECLMMSATHTHSAARAFGANGYSTKPDEMEPYQHFMARPD